MGFSKALASNMALGISTGPNLAQMKDPRTAHLLQDVLLPHQLLPLPVGFGHHDVQHVLAIVGDVADEKHQVLQQLDHEPAHGHGAEGLRGPQPHLGPSNNASAFWRTKELVLPSLVEVNGALQQEGYSPYGSYGN